MVGLRPLLLLLGALACLPAPTSALPAARNVPGAFDYYVLVLTWGPSYCQGEGRGRGDGQCAARTRHAFLLHGLWPQFERGWPESCPTPKRPWVPDKVIEEMRDIMPSKSLMIHEYRVHGTCSGLDPAQYFGVARELYERVTIPQSFAAGETGNLDSPDAIQRAFLDANPWLTPEMIAVTCRRDSLLDIRLCFGRDFFPRACGGNEDQKRLCPVAKIAVPPVAP
jgi:ribonuclease T2